jgi:hypothetical protein
MTDSTLTELQRLVLEIFFALPESDGFVLAGGAALVASGLTERPTQDVDLFGSDVVTGITAAADALEVACTDRGWTTERIRDSATFRRLIVRSPSDELLVDLAVDSPPLGAPTITAFGPTYPPRELAARKLLALFDRAEARDFVDATRCRSASTSTSYSASPMTSMMASCQRSSPRCWRRTAASPTATSPTSAATQSACERGPMSGGVG